jgi:hypothetical protein
MLRSVLAVITGFVVIALLALGSDAIARSIAPDKFGPGGQVGDVGLLILTEIYVFIFAAFGCYLCSRIARRRPMFHALVLGVLGLVFNVIGASMTWQLYPRWYTVIGLLAVMPAAWIGGRIAERQMTTRPVTLAGAAA